MFFLYKMSNQQLHHYKFQLQYLGNEVNKQWFQYIMSAVHNLSHDHAEDVFNEISGNEKPFITYGK